LDSKILAVHLGRIGFEARSLAGGMAAWMRVVVPIEVDPPRGFDRVIQFDRRGKGCLGYLLISGEEALILDPPLYSEAYIEALGSSGATLVGVVDTHVHADYVSGAVRLSRLYGVPYYLHPLDAVYPYDGTPGVIEYTPLAGGERIPVGRTSLEVLHTPGHTEGSVTLLAKDQMAFTGDFLFVESIGRPDLGGREEEWAAQLWDSVAEAIRRWDDGMVVCPAHYASEKERRMGKVVGIPFGALRKENDLLRIQDSDLFIRRVLENKAPFPEAYKKIKAINLNLLPAVEEEVEELEIGRNECALGGT
jgi:glyoxylase-like metal-dependent hydrolase (beta-lactamase superfamily II)